LITRYTHIHCIWSPTLLAWYRHLKGINLFYWPKPSTISDMMQSYKCFPHEYWWRFPGLKTTELIITSHVFNRGYPLDGGGHCQFIISKAIQWTIVGCMFRGCPAPCTMKILFVDFRKEYQAHGSRYKRLHCCPFLSTIFQWQSIVVINAGPPCPE
jgi:hypothetical protein